MQYGKNNLKETKEKKKMKKQIIEKNKLTKFVKEITCKETPMFQSSSS